MGQTAHATKSILALNAFAPDRGAALSEDVERLVARRRRSFGATSVLFYDKPLHIVGAKGAEIFAADGRTYLDLYNNVPSVGHCHPRVAAAAARQMGRYNTHTRYLFDEVHAYAERLLALLPTPLSNVAFTCTGSESNDLALRIIRGATGGAGIVVTEAAYHGNTAAVTEVSPSSYKKGAPPSHVRMVPPPHPRWYGADVGAGFAAAIAAAAKAMQAEGVAFAGLLVDSIFSSDGVYADPAGFLSAAFDVTRALGGLVIADEVQPGFARTGSHMWGFARHGVTPDVVTMGKPMGNGFPMGAVTARPELLARFADEFGYFNTFGGNPVASAAGLAVLDVLADEGLMDNARRVGAHIAERLDGVRPRLAAIGEVRGAGLYLGVDIVSPETGEADPDGASALINRLRNSGILIGAAGPLGHVLKVRPPLCLTLAQADQFVDALEETLDA